MTKRKIVLISKYLDKTLTPKEELEFQQLLLNAEINADELNEYLLITDRSKTIDIPDFQIKELPILQARERTNQRDIKPHTITIKRLIKVAAIFIVGITLGILVMYKGFVKNDQYVEVETKHGDKIHLTIPGKNEVWLNSGSSIKYAASFTGSSRVIDLTGEAYFRFPDSEGTPLIINCNETKIICTKGSLNVENDTIKNTVEIEVEKGWIAISNSNFGDQQFIVEAGFKGTINDMIPLWIEQNRDPNYLAWHTGIMRFRNTPMKDVAKTLAEVYDIQVDVEGDLKYCFLTKDFNNKSLEHVLKEIKDTLKANIQQQNNSIIITGNPC